jgi:trk system potassium uptake protein TrkA
MGVRLRMIEINPEKCLRLSDELDGVLVINADGTDQELLDSENVGECGALICLTNRDEENIILSLYARSHMEGKVVTKIKRLDYDDIIEKLDLDTVIYPKNLVATSIARYVRATKNTLGSNMESLHSIIQGEVEAAEFVVRETSAVVGVPLAELRLRKEIIIAAIIRGKQLIFPNGQDTIEIGDSVIVVSKEKALKDITDCIIGGKR